MILFLEHSTPVEITTQFSVTTNSSLQLQGHSVKCLDTFVTKTSITTSSQFGLWARLLFCLSRFFFMPYPFSYFHSYNTEEKASINTHRTSVRRDLRTSGLAFLLEYYLISVERQYSKIQLSDDIILTVTHSPSNSVVCISFSKSQFTENISMLYL